VCPTCHGKGDVSGHDAVSPEDAALVQASVRAFARFVQWEISGDPADEAAYQAEVDRVADLLGDDAAPTPGPAREEGE
jgi:hypothetical protein